MLIALLNGPRFSFMNETISALNGFCDFSVPDGYEDETGFHFGSERSDASCPPMLETTSFGEHI